MKVLNASEQAAVDYWLFCGQRMIDAGVLDAPNPDVNEFPDNMTDEEWIDYCTSFDAEGAQQDYDNWLTLVTAVRKLLDHANKET